MKTNRTTSALARLSRIGIATATFLVSTSAAADLKIAALMEGRGSKSLIAGNLERADRSLPNNTSPTLSYADTNNLCVLQILQRSEAAAVETCQKALTKLQSKTLKRRAKSALSGEMYNNLAVAQLLAGDQAAAQKSLAKALSLASFAKDVISNAEVNEVAFQRRSAIVAK